MPQGGGEARRAASYPLRPDEDGWLHGTGLRRCTDVPSRRNARTGVASPPSRKNDNFLAKAARVFYICSSNLLKETAELSASVDAIRAAAVRNRSMDARAEGRAGRVGRRRSEPRRSGPRDRVAGGPEGRNASRREMAPQRLEKIESAPGNGMAPAASVPQRRTCHARLLPAGGRRQERIAVRVIPGAKAGRRSRLEAAGQKIERPDAIIVFGSCAPTRDNRCESRVCAFKGSVP